MLQACLLGYDTALRPHHPSRPPQAHYNTINLVMTLPSLLGML